MVEALFWLWLAWVVLMLVFFGLGVVLCRHDYPHFNGFAVRIPDSVVVVLTRRELEAVIMHEHGHRAHLHVWKNLLRLLFLVPVTKAVRVRQEIQADDYVTDPLALASALRKISENEFDHVRATRLESRAQ
jgi:Zn-dependent protease with chaperone function